MTCGDNFFIDRWMKHLDGAAQILAVRGSGQLTRREGLDLFTQLRAQIVSSSLCQRPLYHQGPQQLIILTIEFRLVESLLHLPREARSNSS